MKRVATEPLEVTLFKGRANPHGRRVLLEPESPDISLRDYFEASNIDDENGWSPHTWRGNRRSTNEWEAASSVVSDVDYHDADGKHAPVPKEAAKCIQEAAYEERFGSVFHATPRGVRIGFCLDASTRDRKVFVAAARGVAASIEKFLREADLFHAPRRAGFAVDKKVGEDTARFFFAPRASVAGEGRPRDTYLHLPALGELFTATQLASWAPQSPTTEASSRSAAPNGPVAALFAALAALPKARVYADRGVAILCLFHTDTEPSAIAYHVTLDLYCSACSHTWKRREWLSAPEVRALVGEEVADAVLGTARTIQWSKPEPIPDALLPVPPWDDSLLPESLCPWVTDIYERMQCPPEFVAVGAVVGVGIVLGRKLAIRPRALDDFTVVAHPWGGIIGRPGMLKTPALCEALRPLRHLENIARQQHELAVSNFLFDEAVAKAERARFEGELKKAVATGDDVDGLREQLARSVIAAPVLRRYIVNDATVEKLGELLQENPNGLEQVRDELVGFLQNLDREGRESDRAFYLKGWSGLGSFTYDRISRGTKIIEACCVTVLGGIQPGPLRGHIQAAIREGVGADGLVQRLQLLVYPAVSKEWKNVDRKPDINAAASVVRIFEALDGLDPTTLGAQSDAQGGIPFIRFGTDA